MPDPIASFQRSSRVSTPAPSTTATGIYPPGSRFPLLTGVRSRMIQTARLAQHIYESGPTSASAEPVVLIHGNASSARFFEDLMVAMPGYYLVAPDLRGYGASEAKVVDATRGVRDYSDDIHALVEALGIGRFHLIGWSLGGNIAMQYMIDHPERLLSVTLQSPGSPYGYGGTRGVDGVPNWSDFAGSGAGVISREVRAHYESRDASAASPFSPRTTFRQLYVRPPFRLAREREDALIEQMLMMKIGDRFYPGDSVPSAHWPYTAPGVYGSNNALSPKYLNQRALAEVRGGPSILWIRGADDHVVSNTAFTDPAVLGKLRLLPRWPGSEKYPFQPMLNQLRGVLDAYVAHGGHYREEVVANCGHSPHLEHPAKFLQLLTRFLEASASQAA